MALSAVVSTLVAAAGGHQPSSAAQPLPTPPVHVSGRPGTVLADEPMVTDRPGSPRRIVYSTRLQDGTATAVTGTFIDSAAAWTGPGPRPIVVIGPGTRGQGDQCATSIALSDALAATADTSGALAQQLPDAARWAGLGARILITDYIGLGTPGIHTYANRLESAHALLDGARAAAELAGTGPETPIVLWGYSQGGGATAAAAELHPTYAPELNLKGTWAGAPVADLTEVLTHVDGVLIGGVIGFAINGLLARYPELGDALEPALSTAGHAMLDTLGTECIGEVIARQPFLRSGSLTTDGRPLSVHLADIPAAESALADQRIGTLTPASPVLITSARNDDTVPYRQARRLAEDWCDHGAAITFRTNEMPPVLPGATLPSHYGPELLDSLAADNPMAFLLDRLAGNPLTTCQIN